MVDGGQGTVFYQLIHNCVVRQYKSGYSLYIYEWNNSLSKVILPEFNCSRKDYLFEVSEKIQSDVRLFKKIIYMLEHSGNQYTVDDVVAEFKAENKSNYLFSFMENTIRRLKALGKTRTSETYTATLRSFKKFRKNCDILFDDIDAEIIMSYESYLRSRGLVPNSSSFYMRNLRAVYNRAVEKRITTQKKPFKHVYTGVDKTIKRAVSLKYIRQLKNVNLMNNRAYDFARDMFLFSFYTRGMSFVDMAYLRKKDLNSGFLCYRRRKTGQQLQIKWEKCMEEIVKKYETSDSVYLLPIIRQSKDVDERMQYIRAAHKINRSLRMIGSKLKFPIPLTLYVARHSWASIAKNNKVPISVISEGMGHDSETTTRIYLASLDTVAVDKANRMILKSICKL